jgi:subtilisin family serine protease
MRIDPQVLFDGDQMYLRISADEEPFRWNRHSGSRPQWPPGLAETPQSVFEEGTRGFERVDDDAQAKGQRRYMADVDAADLDFMGWFSSTNNTSGPSITNIDIWVDAFTAATGTSTSLPSIRGTAAARIAGPGSAPG